MGWSHEQITSRLEQIEQGFADREERGENAAAAYFKAKRDYEEKYAVIYMGKEGQPTERKQATLLALKSEDAYIELVKAEADYEGWRAAMRTLEARSMIGMALLKSSTREQPNGRVQPEPSWSGR